jgi:DMSO/TMAO reductase YedYZ molybdopterin-dependent catalytic subunit
VAVDPRDLIVLKTEPLNGEVPLPLLDGAVVTPAEHFYVRSHFAVPSIDVSSWRLQVRGLVTNALSLSLDDLKDLPAQTSAVTLECAGNGRSLMSPKVEGEQWGLGAASTAEWTGVPLAEILERAGVQPGAKALLFRGGDGATDAPAGDASRFDRSLTLDEAAASPVLLAYAMNGRPLPKHHGYPLRAIVPGWYAVSAVKWLSEIEVIGHPFSGHFQTTKYVFEWERDGGFVAEPVTHLKIRSLITHPSDGSSVSLGSVPVRGLAWSGRAPIDRVEVSIDGGPWQDARMLGTSSRFCWQRWETVARVDRPGEVSIRSRATDAGGATQPERADWNRHGYGNNSIQTVVVRAG